MAANPDETSDPINVAVIEDDPVLRLVIGILFEDDDRFRICWQAGSAAAVQALARTDERVIDLIVLDDVLEGSTTGAELAPWLHRRWPEAGVVMFTADPEGVEPRPPVAATVAKTTPELLLETARGVVGAGTHARAAAAGASRAAPPPPPSAPWTSAPRRLRRRRTATRPAWVPARPARWAAAAAVLTALVAASGPGPGPGRVVTDLVGHVLEALPGARSQPEADEPHRINGGRGAPPDGRPAVPTTAPVEAAEAPAPGAEPGPARPDVPGAPDTPGRSGAPSPAPPGPPADRRSAGLPVPATNPATPDARRRPTPERAAASAGPAAQPGRPVGPSTSDPRPGAEPRVGPAPLSPAPPRR